MKKLLFAVLAILFSFSATMALAADSVTLSDTYIEQARGMRGAVRVLSWTFSSDGADTTISATAPASLVTGTIMGIKYVPDGTNPPASGADITIMTAASGGDDVLVASGTNIGTSQKRWVPLDSINGGYIFLGTETLYFAAAECSGGSNVDAGVLTIYVLIP